MAGFDRSRINLYELLNCLTSAEDLISPELANHHQKVAYLALKIGEQMEVPFEQRKELVLAGLLHDIGVLSLDEHLEFVENEAPSVWNHAFRGARLLESFPPLRGAAEIIRFHHIPWNHGAGNQFEGKPISPLSHILHLADRVVVAIDGKRDVIGQIKELQQKFKARRGTYFLPEAVDAFLEISAHEYVWLDIVYKPQLSLLPDMILLDVLELDMDDVIALTRIFSWIIDFRSSFTATHSAGVAVIASALAGLAGFSEIECKMMQVAGNLHDLGKLAVKPEVLEKRANLNDEEFNAIRAHTFYTFRLLQSIRGFETINQWASFHHERIDGRGYPFHLGGDSLPLGSRIMAVADVFTAVTEDRPYRRGMHKNQVLTVMKNMADSGALCPYAVSLLASHYDSLNELRMEAQARASESFTDSIGIDGKP